MSSDKFIKVTSTSTTGALSSLPRDIVAVSRETISGFTADANTGLVKITASQVTTFNTANSTKYGFKKFLQTAFAGTVQPNEVYLLSTAGAALTSDMLDTANYSPRAWSFLTVCSQTNGLSDSSTFLADCVVASNWATSGKHKVFFHSYTMEDGGTLPAALLLGGALTTNDRTFTVVTNAYDEIDEYTKVYHNPILAALVFVLYGGTIARSIGSLSDAHDFSDVDADTYSATTRTYIASNSLSQYNGAKDQGGSLFLYDTFLNDSVNPPTTSQIEAIIAEDYIDDYVPVFVRNSLQASGQEGVEASYKGVMQIYALTNTALSNLWKSGAILTNDDGTPNFTLTVASVSEINALDPSWQTSGTIPVGSIVGEIGAFRAIHYVTIKFNYN
jgi:hypothetical protein